MVQTGESIQRDSGKAEKRDLKINPISFPSAFLSQDRSPAREFSPDTVRPPMNSTTTIMPAGCERQPRGATSEPIRDAHISSRCRRQDRRRAADAMVTAYFGSIPDFGQTENGVRFSDVEAKLARSKSRPEGGRHSGSVRRQADQESLRLHRCSAPQQSGRCCRGESSAGRPADCGVGQARTTKVAITTACHSERSEEHK